MSRPPLQRNADYLKRWPSLRITVEGHCDERGTAEYNLSLGERRSNAVKGYLVSLGVAADRITVISKGKETPFCTESNESLLAAEPPRPLRHHREVDAGRRSTRAGVGQRGRSRRSSCTGDAVRPASPSCAAISLGGARGSGAPVIGRPMTR